MFEKSFRGPPPLTTEVKIMLTIWFVILVPWLPLFSIMGTGMAFEGANRAAAYAFIAMAWTYPALVAVAFFFRRRKPILVWLPWLMLAWIPVLGILDSIFSK